MRPMRRHLRSSPARLAHGPSAAIFVATLSVLLLGLSAHPAAAAEPAAPPPLEAADTAPPGAVPAAPVQPIAPLATTPAATPAPPGALTTMSDPGLTPIPPAPRPKPFYRRHWFWGAVGVVLITGAIIGILSLQPDDPATPITKLGDMRAF
jgi:hypothetical protein